MAFITETQFKARFPEFGELDDAVITPFITESGLYVDTTWPSDARALAQGLYVAHSMKLDGYGSSTNLSGNAEISSVLSGVAGITRFKIDDLEVAVSDKVTERAMGDPMSSTSYGRRFVELRNRYFGGGVWA